MSTYRGPDRRRAARPESGSPIDGYFWAALALLGVLFVVDLRPAAPVDAYGLRAQDYLALGGVATLSVTAVLLGARWRISGSVPALWASAMTGLVAAAVALRRFSSSDAVDEHRAGSLGLACMIVALAIGIRMVTSPELDQRLRDRRVVLSSWAVVSITFGLAAAFLALGVRQPVHDGTGAAWPGSLFLATAWFALAAVWLRRGHRERSWAICWSALLAVALGLSELTIGMAILTDRGSVVGTLSLICVGALSAARGASCDLRVALDGQARELDETREHMGATLDQAESARAAAEERAHEARNALHAVGGAIQTLERYHERLDPDTRSNLSAGIARELERLQRLIEVEERSSAPCVFSVREAILPVVTGARAHGLAVEVDIGAALCAIGDPMATAEVVQNLLVNAQRHAGGVDVVVEATLDAGRVLVTVSDGGPGVPPGDRETVFGRDHRGADSVGRGLGLYVSRRLIRAQGGELWVADRPGGGAVFAFDLAASTLDLDRLSARGPAADELHQIRDAGGAI